MVGFPLFGPRPKIYRPMESNSGRASPMRSAASFSFLYFKKIKNLKIYVCFENFRKYPRSPGQGRQGSCRPSNGRQDLNVIFFELAKRSLAEGGGAVAPPGDRGSPTLYKAWLPFPSYVSLKIAPKIQKKREG